MTSRTGIPTPPDSRDLQSHSLLHEKQDPDKPQSSPRTEVSLTKLTESVSLLPTGDGSLTLYHHRWGASYRSTDGAVTESRHVFLEGSRLTQHPGFWHVLELGFGGAINFLVTALACLQNPQVSGLRYWSVEQEPLPASLWTQESYTSWVSEPALLSLVQQVSALAQSPHGTWVQAQTTVSQKLIQLSVFPGEWQQAPPLPCQVHAVYHDPFDPKVNPDAWSEDCFRWSRQSLYHNGFLATYSAAGNVRRAMQAAGYQWQKLPGTGRKREITIASPLAIARADGK